MTNTSPPKPQRKLTSLELSGPPRGALRRLKTRHGMSFTHSVERGVRELETSLLPEPRTDAERAELGLRIHTAKSLLDASRQNRKRGAK